MDSSFFLHTAEPMWKVLSPHCAASAKPHILHKGHSTISKKKNGSTLISRAKFDQDVILATVKCLGDYIWVQA